MVAFEPTATITRLSNEGVALLQTERLNDAGPLLRQALALGRSQPVPDVARIADCLNNLGEWHRLRQEWAEAGICYREALGLLEPAAGAPPDESAVGTTLNNLALMLRQSGQLAEAEPLYRRVLAIFEREHGPASIPVASVLNNLAQILAHTDRQAGAEPLMRRAIGIFEASFGAMHPNVAIALNNLARLLEEHGRPREAEPLARRQVEIFQAFERATGERHAYRRPASDYYEGLLGRLGFRVRTARVRLRAQDEGKSVADLPATDPAPPEQPDFDGLARAASAPGAGIEVRTNLYAAAFRLPKWHFIARGTPPDVQPYIAANQSIAAGAPMLKAFTETDRLDTFARENDLALPTGEVQFLSLPVETILPVLEGFAANGVTHLHFNADSLSDGFFAPLPQMPVIRQYLEAQGRL